MALAPVVAAALTDHSSRGRMLTIAGFDVIRQPGLAGNGYGVDPDTITVDEAGPGGASSMTFTIDDPGLAVPVPARGDEILFVDLANNRTIFRGWVQARTVKPDFGDQGRSISVRAIGPEALLDWAWVPPMTFSSFPSAIVYNAILSVVAAAIGRGPLRASTDPATDQGAQATPVGALGALVQETTGPPVWFSGPQSIPGGTLREAIRQVLALSYRNGLTFGPITAFVTVDMDLGLRVYTTIPTDWVTLAIVDTAAGALRAEGIEDTLDASSVPAAVVVTGAPGIQVVVSDGSGDVGQVAQLNDSTLADVSSATIAGIAYLANLAATTRGTIPITAWAPTLDVHAGGRVTVTDARLGFAAVTYQIGSIQRRFLDTLEDWTITYGGRPPTFTAALRRATLQQLA
jgi:hypothetical protein